jgi:hypothetical protein
MGTASVIHQIATQEVTAKTARASLLSPAGWAKKYIAKKVSGPANNPKVFLFQLIYWYSSIAAAADMAL